MHPLRSLSAALCATVTVALAVTSPALAGTGSGLLTITSPPYPPCPVTYTYTGTGPDGTSPLPLNIASVAPNITSGVCTALTVNSLAVHFSGPAGTPGGASMDIDATLKAPPFVCRYVGTAILGTWVTPATYAPDYWEFAAPSTTLPSVTGCPAATATGRLTGTN